MKKILKDKEIYVFLLIVLVFFSPFIIMNYSVDTYLLLASPRLRYVYEYISAGRFLTAGFFFIQGFLHLPEYIMYISSYILAAVAATFSMYELNKVLDKYINNKYLSMILSVGIIINPFVIELFLFIESGIMILSILSCIEAFKYFDEFLKKKDKKLLNKSLIWMLVALFSYQGTVAIFISLCVLSIIKNSKNIKEFLMNNLYMIGLYLIPTIINYIFVILFSRERVGSNHNIVKVVKMILISTKEELINGFGLLPKYILPLLLVLSISLAIYYSIFSKNKSKSILSVAYLIGMIYLFTIAPIIPQNSDSLIIFPRTSYAFGSLIALLFVLINNKENYKVLGTIIVLLLVVELYSFTKIGIDRYILNYYDKDIIMQVKDKVEKYENATGNQIKYISLYNQKNSHMFLNDLNDNINVSPRSENPNCTALFVYYTKKNVKVKKSNNEIYNKYFKNKHWQWFNQEQVVLDGDTLHWYIY